MTSKNSATTKILRKHSLLKGNTQPHFISSGSTGIKPTSLWTAAHFSCPVLHHRRVLITQLKLNTNRNVALIPAFRWIQSNPNSQAKYIFILLLAKFLEQMRESLESNSANHRVRNSIYVNNKWYRKFVSGYVSVLSKSCSLLQTQIADLLFIPRLY